MPLIIVCGVPCSGKSKRTEEISRILEKRQKSVVIISDQVCGIEYKDYGNFDKEKEARGKIRSELNKSISQDTYTIIDSANYIKVHLNRTPLNIISNQETSMYSKQTLNLILGVPLRIVVCRKGIINTLLHSSTCSEL